MASKLPQVIVRAPKSDIQAWKDAAGADRLSLAAWIRLLANKAAKKMQREAA